MNTIATQIEALGGNRAVFNATYPEYSLVGTPRSVAPGAATGVEAYSSQADETSATGFLVRNRKGRFEPQPGNLTPGLPGSELIKIATQASQPWPHSTTPGEKAAGDWIARRLNLVGRCGDPTVLCDMRAQYYLNFNAAWGTLLTQLQALKYSKSEKSFTAADFNAVKADFVAEFPLVDRVSKYINNLQEPLNRAEGRGHVDLAKIAQTIEGDLQTAAQCATLSNTLTLLSYVAALGKLAPSFGGPFATALSASLALAGYLTRPSGGSNAGVLDTTVSELRDELTARFDAYHGEIVHLGHVIVSDPAKLQAVAVKVYTDGWRLDGGYQRMLDTVTKTSQAWFYTALMPVPWALWRLETYGNVISKASDWFCTTGPDHEGSFIYFFDQVTDSGQEVHPIAFPKGVPFPQVSVLGPQGIDWGQEIDIRPAHPAATTTDPLFLPVDNPNPKALGLQRWTFYSPFVFKTKIAWPYYDNCEHGYTPPIR